MEDKNEIFYDLEPQNDFMSGAGPWETPKPLLPLMSGLSEAAGFGGGAALAAGETDSASSVGEMRSRLKSERLKESLKRHQEEMERLIKNISLRIKGQKGTDSPPPSPFRYENEAVLDFDFSLNKHKGNNGKLVIIAFRFSSLLGNFLRKLSPKSNHFNFRFSLQALTLSGSQ